MEPARDFRSALVLVEPQFISGEVAWHGMAFAGGEVVTDIVGGERAAVLGDCVDAIEAALGAPNPSG